MATKLNVGIDEELVRQMISGQTPPSTNVIRKSVSKEADNPPASVVAAPEDSSKPDSPPSGMVVSERQDVKPESAPVPDIRRRRSMTLPDYKKTFLARVDYDLRASLYVSAPTKRKILEVLKKIGGERLTATSYVDNILRHHLEMFRDEINRIHQEQNYHNII